MPSLVKSDIGTPESRFDKSNIGIPTPTNIYVFQKYCSGQKTPESWGRLSEALGNWGSGNLEGGGFGERVGTGEVSLKATWDRGGRILSQLGGFQVSRKGVKGVRKGSKGESARGDKKQGECAMYIAICARVYKECLKRLNDTSCIYAGWRP